MNRRPLALVQLASRLASQALRGLRLTIPIDLFRLAQSRHIHTIELRPLLADGCMFVHEGGFKVQICDKNAEVLQPGRMLVTRAFTVKQRFTLAHEIAHTLVYEIAISPPGIKRAILNLIEETDGGSREQNLESFCQIAAGFLLVPPRSLRHERALGPWGRVDSLEHLRGLSRRFYVSPEVMIHSVADHGRDEVTDEDVKDPDFALMMVRQYGGRESIVAWMCGSTFNGLLRQPRLYTKVSTWVEKNSILRKCNLLLDVEEGEWTRPTTTGSLRIRKREYKRTPRSYFLELKHFSG